MSKSKVSLSSLNSLNDKFTSPLMMTVFRLRAMRNDKEDYLLGRVLTLIDGLIVDEKQNKAVKDMVKSIFHEPTYHWDMEELLCQFKDKYCKDVENGYQHKLESERPKSPALNYFN